MKSNFKYLEWDSNFFEIPVYSCTNVEYVKSIFDAENSTDVMVYLYCEIRHDSINEYLCDEKVTFVATFSEKQNLPIKSTAGELEYVNILDTEIIDLAIESSRLSRFRMDKELSSIKVDELYKIWAEGAIKSKKVLVCRINGKIEGLLIYSGAEALYKIEIIAVRSIVRGRGIGKSLICKMINDLSSKAGVKIQVVTQGANCEAKRLYESLGFEIEKEEYVYHLHKKIMK